MATEEEVQAFEERVLNALELTPTAAKELAERLGLAWNGPEIAELHATLQMLHHAGKIGLTYGRGWFKVGGKDGLTPYDRGERLEPKPWVVHRRPVVYPDESYGRVDFDNDEAATVATLWIERREDGSYVLRGYNNEPLEVQIDDQT